MKKVQLGYRISIVGKSLMEAIAKDLGISEAGVLEIALRELAKSRGIAIPDPEEIAPK